MPNPDAVAALLRDVLNQHTVKLLDGSISPARWSRECEQDIRRHWWATYADALGREPTPDEERMLGRQLNQQLGYLHRFRDQIKNGELTEAQIAARIQQYPNALRGLSHQGELDGMGLRLPQWPGDGQTRCLNNCQCNLRIEKVSTDFGQEWHVYWELGAAEHCEDCLRLADEWKPLVVRA